MLALPFAGDVLRGDSGRCLDSDRLRVYTAVYIKVDERPKKRKVSPVPTTVEEKKRYAEERKRKADSCTLTCAFAHLHSKGHVSPPAGCRPYTSIVRRLFGPF